MLEYSYIGRDNDYTRFFMHHGILGQKWGIRRFQNPDGSLTDLGRKRYSKMGMSPDDREERWLDPKRNLDDYVLKKGTAVNRVERNDPEDPTYRDPSVKGAYVSVDNFIDRGVNGKAFYTDWMSGHGVYTDVTEMNISEHFRNNFANNKTTLSGISSALAKRGYDAMEDIYDVDTSMPIIVFDMDKSFKKTKTTSALDYVKSDEYKKEADKMMAEWEAQNRKRRGG